jgi:DNA-cytosine methyltransferase
MDVWEDCAGLGTVRDAALEVGNSLDMSVVGWRATESNPLLQSMLKTSGHFKKVKKDMHKVKLKDVLQKRRQGRGMLYACGFNCQGFSIQGSQKGMKDERSDTLKSAYRFIANVLPDIVLLENVKNFTAPKFAKARSKLQRMLIKKGYKVKDRVLDTRDHGLPQHRERYYLVAIRRDRMQATAKRLRWPRPQPKRPLHRLIDLNFEEKFQKGTLIREIGNLSQRRSKVSGKRRRARLSQT